MEITANLYAAICQVKARYCHHLDHRQWQAFAELFTPDLVMELPGVGVLEGRDRALAFIRQALAGARTCHQVHPPRLVALDGGVEAIFPMQDANAFEPPRHGVLFQRGFGHYREHYRYTDQGWRIAHQRLDYWRLDLEREETP